MRNGVAAEPKSLIRKEPARHLSLIKVPRERLTVRKKQMTVCLANRYHNILLSMSPFRMISSVRLKPTIFAMVDIDKNPLLEQSTWIQVRGDRYLYYCTVTEPKVWIYASL